MKPQFISRCILLTSLMVFTHQNVQAQISNDEIQQADQSTTESISQLSELATEGALVLDRVLETNEDESRMLSGNWSLDHKWIRHDGSSAFGAVIVKGNNNRYYRLCRSGSNTAGTGSKELRVYVNDTIEEGIGNYSLDIGSCILTEAHTLALRYNGPDASSDRLLFGSFEEIDETTLKPFVYENVSKWSLQWEKGIVGFHSAVLINGIQGDYQICFDGGEVSPPLTGDRPNIVSLRLKVDNSYIESFDSRASYRGRNCTNVSGKEIIVEQHFHSPNINYYKLVGSVRKKTNKTAS